MANAVYPGFKTATLNSGVTLVASTVKAVLVSTSTGTTNYTYSSAHANLSDVASGSIVATAVALSTKAVSAGAFTAASVVFPSVTQTASQTGQAIIYYIDTGTGSTSTLIGYIDTATGLPVTPNGGNITISFSGNVLTLS